MSIAHIALGANLGRRKSTIAAALEAVSALSGTRVIAVAAFRETAPVNAPAGSGAFINTAATIETSLDPLALLRALLQIERELGRSRSRELPPNAPRSIDLDILLYGDRIIDSPELSLPHPRMHLRRFVLEPLREIAPTAVHPVYHKTVQQLFDELAGNEIEPSRIEAS